MTRRRISPRAAEAIKVQLAEIIKDLLDNNGQLVTTDALALEHVKRNSSLRAEAEVGHYGGPAIISLRREHGYAIVPVTAQIATYLTTTSPDDKLVADTVAGLGAGGNKVGWFQPTGKDDPLWIAYIGHLGKSGVHAVYHAATSLDANAALLTTSGVTAVNGKVTGSLPVPAGKSEKKLLKADIDRT